MIAQSYRSEAQALKDLWPIADGDMDANADLCTAWMRLEALAEQEDAQRSAPTPFICPECDGEGTLTHQGGPGYYDRGFGNYLPSEHEVECETCGGSGWLGEDE